MLWTVGLSVLPRSLHNSQRPTPQNGILRVSEWTRLLELTLGDNTKGLIKFHPIPSLFGPFAHCRPFCSP